MARGIYLIYIAHFLNANCSIVGVSDFVFERASTPSSPPPLSFSVAFEIFAKKLSTFSFFFKFWSSARVSPPLISAIPTVFCWRWLFS